MMRKQFEVAFITTTHHNVGDDFVREGIIHLLAARLPHAKFSSIHKHSPITAFNLLEGVRSPRVSELLYPLLQRLKLLDNKLIGCDLAIQSGAPIYWCHPGTAHCADNEWFGPLIRDTFVPARRTRRLMNIAGGSCQRFQSTGSEPEICPRCIQYIQELFDVCDLTILRDEVAARMLNLADRSAVVLPCSSIFARDRFGILPRAGEYIVVNFMENGGHYTFGQQIDISAWRKHFVELVRQTKHIGRVVIACHSESERRLAAELSPETDIFYIPDDHRALIEFYSHARFGIVNRVHAGFLMASLGKPVTVIGTDSRALMIKNIGLDCQFVSDISDTSWAPILDNLITREATYRDEIEDIRDTTRSRYRELLSPFL